MRRWRLDEIERFFDIYRRPEVVRWLGAEPMRDRGHGIEMIERNLARQRARSRFGSWAVVDHSSGAPVGSVILKELPTVTARSRSVGSFTQTAGARGSQEAAGAVVERSLADGLPEIWAVTYLDNHRSAAVCRRIGMQLLGITYRW